MLPVLSASLFLLLRPFCHTFSRHSRNRLPPHIEVSSQGYSSKKKHRCTERISTRVRRPVTNVSLAIAAWTTRASTSVSTGGRVYCFLRLRQQLTPIVRNLPAVLSSEV